MQGLFFRLSLNSIQNSHVQSEQQKLEKLQNLLRLNNNDTRTTCLNVSIFYFDTIIIYMQVYLSLRDFW